MMVKKFSQKEFGRRGEQSKPRQSKRKETADLTDFAVSTMSSTYISFGKT
jgi:hypothetical protein